MSGRNKEYVSDLAMIVNSIRQNLADLDSIFKQLAEFDKADESVVQSVKDLNTLAEAVDEVEREYEDAFHGGIGFSRYEDKHGR